MSVCSLSLVIVTAVTFAACGGKNKFKDLAAYRSELHKVGVKIGAWDKNGNKLSTRVVAASNSTDVNMKMDFISNYHGSDEGDYTIGSYVLAGNIMKMTFSGKQGANIWTETTWVDYNLKKAVNDKGKVFYGASTTQTLYDGLMAHELSDFKEQIVAYVELMYDKYWDIRESSGARYYSVKPSMLVALDSATGELFDLQQTATNTISANILKGGALTFIYRAPQVSADFKFAIGGQKVVYGIS